MLPGKRFTFDDIARIAWRGKWILIAPAIVTSVIAATYLRFVPDVYRADTTILVVAQRVPDIYVKSTVTSRIQDRLQSISPQILSRSRLEPIIVDLNLYPDRRQQEPMEDVIAYMRSQVEVITVRGDAFVVGYRSESPVLAQQVTERLASLFIEENLRDRELQAENTNQFLESQLNDARKRLIEHEKRLETFRMRYAGELPTQAGNNFQAVQTLQMEAQGITDSIERDRDRRLVLERSLADLSFVPDPADGTARVDTGDDVVQGPGRRPSSRTAREALRAMRTRLKPEHPDVIRGERIVVELEQKARVEQAAMAAAAGGAGAPSSAPVSAAERRARGLRDELAQVSSTIKTKETRLVKLQEQLAGYRSRLDAAPARESEMTELMRDYETLQTGYRSLLAKREESKVAANLERRQIGEQFRVLDPPRRPERPFSPNRPLVQAIGTLLGLAIGLGIIVLLQVRDQTMHKEADIARFAGPARCWPPCRACATPKSGARIYGRSSACRALQLRASASRSPLPGAGCARARSCITSTTA